MDGYETNSSAKRNRLLPLIQAIAAAWFGLVGIVGMVLLLNSERYNYLLMEWLVSYAAGFVRRGMAGEIVFALAGITGWSCAGIIKLIGASTLIAFLALYVRRLIRLPGLDQNERFALLFMPTSISFILLNTANMIRKEYLLFLVFFGFLELLERWERLPRWPMLLYLAVAGSFAVLMHEVFVFLFMPFLCLLLWAKAARESGSAARGAIQASTLLAIPAAVACFTILARPGPNAVEVICAHAQAYVSELSCTPPPLPLAFLGMNSKQALSIAYMEFIQPRVAGLPVIVSWGAAYCLFIWIHFAILVRVLRAQLGAGSDDCPRRIATLLCGLNVLLAAGMSVISVDLGRWIFILATLSTLTAGSNAAAKGLSSLIGLLNPGRVLPPWPSRRSCRLHVVRLPCGACIPVVPLSALLCSPRIRFHHDRPRHPQLLRPRPRLGGALAPLEAMVF